MEDLFQPKSSGAGGWVWPGPCPDSRTEPLAMPVGLHSQCGVRLIHQIRDAWALFYPHLLYYQTGTAVFYLLFAVVQDVCM